MTAFEGMQSFLVRGSAGVETTSEKSDNIWVETARAIIEEANKLGDEITIDACQRVIDDGSSGDLPAQSDVNVVLGFLNVHAH
jgi:hypothetical protein